MNGMTHDRYPLWNPGDRVTVELAPGKWYEGTLWQAPLVTHIAGDPVWHVRLDEDGDDYAVVQSNLRRLSVTA